MKFDTYIARSVWLSLGVSLAACATLTNDANIPIEVSFADGSRGSCSFSNKRGEWTSEVPTEAVMIRRSDDELVYQCETNDGRTASGSIESEEEDSSVSVGGKVDANIIFMDLGIADALSDKAWSYPEQIIVPVRPLPPN